jgi:hypothetical protein
VTLPVKKRGGDVTVAVKLTSAGSGPPSAEESVITVFLPA